VSSNPYLRDLSRNGHKPHEPEPVAEPEVLLPHLKLRRMSDVEAEPVQWLWTNRFPLGKFNLLGGDPGKGKSHFSLDLSARVTTGNVFPDGSGRCPMGSVLILSAEDDAEDTIAPRLLRAGADVSKVYEIQATRMPETKSGDMKDRVFSLEADLPLLDQSLTDIGDVKLLIIDPISSYLGKTDSHKNSEVRGLIAPVAELARRHHVCILGITHMNKGTGNKSSYRMTGSLAFAAAARSVWLWAEDTQQPGRLLLLPGKNNLAARQDALACKIMSDERGTFLAWEADPVALTADGYLEQEANHSADGDDGKMREAIEFLHESLADGPMLSSELEETARQHGITKRTLDRARKQLNCKPSKRLSDKKWQVSLPTESNHAIKQSNGNVGYVGNVGTVGEW